MSDVDALFRLLTAAPPRSAEIVKRVALGQKSFPQIALLHTKTLAKLILQSHLDDKYLSTAIASDTPSA